jgi:hypothetical protein
MRYNSWRQQGAWLVVMAGLLGTGALAQARAQDDDRRPPTEPRFWIGLVVTPVGEVLRDQLKLEAGQGVVVERVAPDSPAANAGIKRHDVLLKAGDQSLGSVEDLMRVVQSADGKSISLTRISGGERSTVELKPEERHPDGPRPPHPPGPRGPRPPAGPDDVVTLVPSDLPQQVWRMLRPGLPLDFKFPDDLSLTVNKQGNEPGKITVKRGEKTWEVTDDKLSELPDSVRGFVELYLGKIPTPPLPPEVEESLARGLPVPLPPGLPELRQRLRGETEHIERRIGDEALPRVRELQDRLEGIERRLQRRLQEVEKRLEEQSASPAKSSNDTDQ